MSKSADYPLEPTRVTWIGECGCGHEISQTLPVSREDRPDVWVACRECGRENNLSETEARDP
jgi:hypothetical protein